MVSNIELLLLRPNEKWQNTVKEDRSDVVLMVYLCCGRSYLYCSRTSVLCRRPRLLRVTDRSLLSVHGCEKCCEFVAFNGQFYALRTHICLTKTVAYGYCFAAMCIDFLTYMKE